MKTYTIIKAFIIILTYLNEFLFSSALKMITCIFRITKLCCIYLGEFEIHSRIVCICNTIVRCSLKRRTIHTNFYSFCVQLWLTNLTYLRERFNNWVEALECCTDVRGHQKLILGHERMQSRNNSVVCVCWLTSLIRISIKIAL